MLKKTLYKHTREFLERNLPENFFLFKKSNKKRTKYFSLKSAVIKLNLSKLKLDKISKKTFLLHEKKSLNFSASNAYKIESQSKFLFNLHTIKSQFEKRQTRNSDFKNKLKEKKKLAILYGNLSNKAIKQALQKARKQGGNVNVNLLHILEKRLDIILYRALFFPTINTAKQWLKNNKISVNYRLTNIPSYMVNTGDIISVPESSRKYISNNIIKYFIHYKLIHNVNENMRTDSLKKNEVFSSFSVLGEKTSQQFKQRQNKQTNNVKLTSECLTIINNLNITLNQTFQFVVHKKNLSKLMKNFLYFANLHKYNISLNMISIINSFQYKPFKLKADFFIKNSDSRLGKLRFPSYWGKSPCFVPLLCNAKGKNEVVSYLAWLPCFASLGKNEVFSYQMGLTGKNSVFFKHGPTEFFENKTLMYSKKFSILHDNKAAGVKTNQKYMEKLVFNSILQGEILVAKAAVTLAESFAKEKTKFFLPFSGTQTRYGPTGIKQSRKMKLKPLLTPPLQNPIMPDKYKLNLYKAFLQLKQNDLNLSKMYFYNYMFYLKLAHLKYICKYVYSYNFIVKKILFVKYYFKLKPRNIVNTLYFKVLWCQVNFKNIFFLRQTINLLKNRFIINDISCNANSLKKKLIKNQFNTNVEYTYTDIFNRKCQIIQIKINRKMRNAVLNIINVIMNAYKKNNNNFLGFTRNKTDFPRLKSFKQENLIKFLGKINSTINATKHYDFLFFLKLKKIFSNKSHQQIHESLPKMFNYHYDDSEIFGKINIKPLNLEISYRTLTIIYLFPPQKLVFPCSLDVELLVKYDI